MTTSLHTFRQNFRDALLDLLHGQWSQFGFAFAQSRASDQEVIDPEALLWCSLAFVREEPRLGEAVEAWFIVHSDEVLRQRLVKRLKADSIRARMLNDLKRGGSIHPAPDSGAGDEAFSNSARAFHGLVHRKQRRQEVRLRLGKVLQTPATALVRARRHFGGDVLHFLLVFLLANEAGGHLRDIAAWSGYTYRSIFAVADRWREEGKVTIEHGFCVLLHRDRWTWILGLEKSPRFHIVNWFEVFDICLEQLGQLERAANQGLDLQSSVVQTLRKEAISQLLPYSYRPGECGKNSVAELIHQIEKTRTIQ